MAGGRVLVAGGVRRSDSDGDLALDDAVSRTYRLFFLVGRVEVVF